MILVHLDITDSILLKSNDNSFHALYHIMKQMDLDNNIWYADKINKGHICLELKISSVTLEKMIASLKKRDLLVKRSRGKYKLSNYLIEDY
jgi:DNA-binding MarR family transcriptional regulator